MKNKLTLRLIMKKYALSSADFAPKSAPILLQGSVQDNIKKAAELGYQGLEVHMRETTILNYDELIRVSDGHGVKISAIVTGRLHTQGGVSLLDDRPYIIKAAMEGMGSYIEMASKLKTDLIIGWIKGNVPESGCRAYYMERLANNLRVLSDQAAAQGVRMMLEVINRYEVNVFTTVKETLDFLVKWNIPNVYVHLDTFHMNIDEANPLEAIRMCGEKLAYFHIADNTRCYPGSGTLDFKSYLDVLKEIAYKGYISVECLPEPDGETAAKKALAHLHKCG